MTKKVALKPSPRRALPAGWGFVFSLVAVLVILFFRSFDPDQVLFSNDGPLGAQASACAAMPEGFRGVWQDLNSLGADYGTRAPNLTSALDVVLGPLGFAKFYPPLTLLFLGLCAWVFFRQAGLGRAAAGLGGLAAALNSGFFSVACWGVGPQAVCFGFNFLALAALMRAGPYPWLNAMLAGFAVGLGVTEGADIGAIFSLLVAAFALYQSSTAVSNLSKGLFRGALRVALVAGCAVFIAAHSVSVLTGIAIKGVSGTQQDTRTKAERWDWATQWSLPKIETLGFVVPGLFGYRMDTPDGGNYWGAAGRDPAWDRFFKEGGQGPPPMGFLRYSGGGFYAGVLVVLVGVWVACQTLRRKDSEFSPDQRRLLWFWLGVVVVALLLAYGRFAPFYQFFYALPYFSTIRNPTKFIHWVSFGLVVLFAYGVDGLWRKYVQPAGALASPQWPGLASGWAKAGPFEKRWTLGCAVALGLSVLAWAIYSLSRASLIEYLQVVQFDEPSARAIADFSIRQVGWFILFFVLAAGLMLLMFTGAFAGRRARWGAGLLGALLVIDLGRANLPWIIYWDYKEKYATNPVIELLRDKPHEHRVAVLPRWPFEFLSVPQPLLAAQRFLNQVYGVQWAQHQFLYYNIQSLDIIQMPRVPQDLEAYESALRFDGTTNTVHRIARRWQLTNTRYLLGAAGYLELLNQQLDPTHRSFRIAAAFELVPKAGLAQATRLEDLTAVLKSDGPFALFEFARALPRVSLYSHWQAMTNDTAVLDLLASKEFDPAQTVLVSGTIAAASPASATNATAGTVQFVSYAPKHIVLRAQADAPAVLLLNDRYDPRWTVRVDERPETLLRCNFIMRGVLLPPGEHRVEFRFEPDLSAMYVSSAAIAVALGLLGYVLLTSRGKFPTPPIASGGTAR